MSEYLVIGMNKEELDTPVLLIDLDILEKNIKTMGDYYNQKNSALRPHQRGHRLPLIAENQLDCGARGVPITSLGLAEYYDGCSITDILKALSGKALDVHTAVNVAAELYMGTGTCGVQIEEAKSFAKEVEKVKDVRFKGICRCSHESSCTTGDL
ncbi:MAG: hypothetical protein HXS46_09065 [Theionarchaea archaeon]|nr:MAG: hypothetical protein AYK18_02255 [Theionarchaea archaeon DG-70]MBU7010827.1 hypothetical protein [Theionarchaea archaeon]